MKISRRDLLKGISAVSASTVVAKDLYANQATDFKLTGNSPNIKSYVHKQELHSKEITINHRLNSFECTLMLYDSNSNQLFGPTMIVEHTDADNIRLVLGKKFCGTIVVMAT